MFAGFEASIWHERRTTLLSSKGSESVIYDVYAVMVTAEMSRRAARTSPSSLGGCSAWSPARNGKSPAPEGWVGMSYVPSYDLTFLDSQGITWFRSNCGNLLERESSVFHCTYESRASFN